jgi:ribosomal protein S18 acetylase RimI-like enzyme
MTGYRTSRKYRVDKTETRESATMSLQLVVLDRPYVKIFPQPPQEIKRYQQIIKQGTSLGAYDEGRLVGLAIAELRDWNRSLWVWELGVDEKHGMVGVGTKLVEELTHLARNLKLHVVVCETQDTNVPAIEFYRKAGFELDGVDLSYYTNVDMRIGEIALFMKRKVE